MPLVIFICAVIPTTLLRGWALYVLWDWFMTPLGVGAIGIAQALGLSLLVSLFTSHLQHDQTNLTGDDATERALRRVFTAFLSPLFALAFGWIVHLFM